VLPYLRKKKENLTEEKAPLLTDRGSTGERGVHRVSLEKGTIRLLEKGGVGVEKSFSSAKRFRTQVSESGGKRGFLKALHALSGDKENRIQQFHKKRDESPGKKPDASISTFKRKQKKQSPCKCERGEKGLPKPPQSKKKEGESLVFRVEMSYKYRDNQTWV